ncbi:phage tail sheath family protein [Chryseobacterium oryctis]|uniref:Phage tail sheath subtilisin-like domain-containing protein n=1 Tax=Chryseobacterium oryctis TaxID=2952618 RepID=A0ABT3HRP4_9FLAO|nr:phage tail sheath C-terminal domain-containing protein [Chryseobacterium oryctis]MCW3162458.1 phage tail sheath subtilisin-like domain-containing protein [Chryseobacterium oryctis]
MNVSSIKTPGVYINEIDAFPPSVAQVETAIPAFIGYTEKGPTVPTRIKSFMEFEQTFGGAPAPKNVTVELDENNTPKDTCSVEESQYKLYNSMKLFYANGGGVCYIVSIGGYKSAITSEAAFINGLDLLRKFDEPTLLLFPDAINLDVAKLGLLHQQALLQCADLMDRFTVMDVKSENGLETDSSNFRDKVGNQNLKYGSAYYPYLQCAFPYDFRFSDINGNTAGKVNFKGIFSTNTDLKKSIEDYEKLINDYNTINTAWNPSPAPADATNPKKLHQAITDGAKLKTAVDKCWKLLEIVGKPDIPDITSTKFATFLQDLISNFLKTHAQDLVDFKKSYEKLKKTDGVTDVDDLSALDNDTKFKSVWGNISTYTESTPNPFDTKIKVSIPADAGPPAVPAHDEPDFVNIQAIIQKLHIGIINTMDGMMKKMYDFMLFEENNLVVQIPFYSAIITKLSSCMNTIPPSGAIVGIYAKTDATRGVWKSPANISVNGIIGVTADINDSDQESMNIHETGKSINPIRSFSGKGFLVWGGRTLAGNSNDWRYINVRRLANMIEESVKKACMQYVFEPNVSQTWVSVKGMIDNYLTTLWNDGALAGSKAEHAFFVSVGLNETMSAQDILEGRMIVKIGYAPSRPAEFIILEFKQMQQRS